jgi:hypothetical protein
MYSNRQADWGQPAGVGWAALAMSLSLAVSYCKPPETQDVSDRPPSEARDRADVSAPRPTGDGPAPGNGADGAANTSDGPPPRAQDAADGAPDLRDASQPANLGDARQGDGAAPTTDVFGVRKIYPTLAGGREWLLPADATRSGGEWVPEDTTIVPAALPAFHTSGQVRMSVVSPAGKAWWRNVEMTGYLRVTQAFGGQDQLPHWEFYARGERHTANPVVASSVNLGVAAPPGTRTWPGYPFPAGALNPHCLGSAYHGNIYVTGRVHVEKETTHTAGYAAARGETNAGALGATSGGWFGFKFVLRNVNGGRNVVSELFLDANADGQWMDVARIEDAGDWLAPGLDGCDAPPFRYTPSQVLDWAGPWVTFRSDAIDMDFKWLSVREIDPLP